MRYKDFKKGDKVFCLMYGEGIIDSIDDYGSYPIFVKFKEQGDILSYNLNGKVAIDRRRTLYVIERKVEEEEILKEYNRLISEVPEVQFVFGELNYTVEFLYSNEGISIFSMFNRNVKHPLYKYISEEKSIEISNKLNKFMKGE